MNIASIIEQRLDRLEAEVGRLRKALTLQGEIYTRGIAAIPKPEPDEWTQFDLTKESYRHALEAIGNRPVAMDNKLALEFQSIANVALHAHKFEGKIHE